MIEKSQRVRSKNEATGMRIVSQYVQEFWECGWQPFDHRNDQGIDGLILMRNKGEDLGVKINIQVKCGATYISSQNDEEIRLSIDDSEGLSKHVEYWRGQNEPIVLVFVNGSKPLRDVHGNIVKDNKNNKTIWQDSRLKAKAWWVNLKDEKLQPEGTKSIICIPKFQTFGEHSKGDFLKLTKPFLNNANLSKIIPNVESKALLYSVNLKKDARYFYNNWQNTYCPGFEDTVIVSKTGWQHIVMSRRGKERRIISMQLLGVAKQIIENTEKYYILTQEENSVEIEQKVGLRARVTIKQIGEQVVQVVLIRRKNKQTQKVKYWFYSVHYRR